MKNAIPNNLFFALGMLLQTGCDLPPAPGTLSDVYTDFDPQGQFAARGFSVEQSTGPNRLSPTEVYGWKPIQGLVELPRNSSGCELVAEAVRDALLQVADGPCLDELKQLPERRRGVPFYGMLRYSAGGMRGLVYVWLFPDETETRINYAILLHEEKKANETRSI